MESWNAVWFCSAPGISGTASVSFPPWPFLGRWYVRSARSFPGTEIPPFSFQLVSALPPFVKQRVFLYLNTIQLRKHEQNIGSCIYRTTRVAGTFWVVLQNGGAFLAVLQYGDPYLEVLQYGGTFLLVPGNSLFCGTFSVVMQYGGTFSAVPSTSFFGCTDFGGSRYCQIWR